MSEEKCTSDYIIKGGVLLAAIMSYHLIPGAKDFITAGIGYLHYRDFAGLRAFILSYGVWAPFTSIFLMTLQSAVPFVPGLAITITNAWIFGWQYGALYSWLGALGGALLDFGVARWYGRPFVERVVKRKHLDLADRFFQRYGIVAVFLTRLTPVIPFKVISYGSGLTDMRLWKYVLATGIGQTPAILLYSILGQHLTQSIRLAMLITTVFSIIGLVIYIYRDKIEGFFFSCKD